MKRYMIERDIPGVGEFSLTELCGAARASNQALANIGPSIQWQHSYVAGDKTFCVYLADSEEEIMKHADLSGIPVSKITEVTQIIDPLTANN
ncbi:DUF4242 domain-containing protein [Marivita sp.]|uniref:DUF4242 domain-containing protein n=1 Tax=Marivita sp. TaxID=2003365 RepID=UPI003A86BF1A